MPKKLKDIVQNSTDLFFVNVSKPDKHDRSTWTFEITDPRWKDGPVKDSKFKTVHLRRDNSFFIAYKMENSFNYFVDEKKAMYRNSIPKYVNSQMYYSVYSNDISFTKNEPSFKITQGEMKTNKINNFLDLCYYYRDYTAIGTGYTRNLRNLVVMDIDVDCTRPDNQEEVHGLLLKFAGYGALPDFCVINHGSRHMQLQWLIKDCAYKDVDWETVNSTIADLAGDPDRNKEVDYRKTDFTKISPSGLKYRKFTMAMTDIVKKRKFGDKNYTFWKAKNPMSALKGVYNLELKMPYFKDGEIFYLSHDQMDSLFSTRESRNAYYEDSPTMEDIYRKLAELMDPLMEKISDKKVQKIVDAEDVSDTRQKQEKKKKEDDFGKSRNTFVLKCTPLTTWKVAKNKGYKKPRHIKNLTKEDFIKFKRDVYKEVKKQFDMEDKKYGGLWPGTTNLSGYSKNEFDTTFNSAFYYAVSEFKNFCYTDEDRKKSQEARHLKMDMKISIVYSIRCQYDKISRTDLLKEVNKELHHNGQKPISMGSLKRYISELNTYQS